MTTTLHSISNLYHGVDFKYKNYATGSGAITLNRSDYIKTRCSRSIQ